MPELRLSEWQTVGPDCQLLGGRCVDTPVSQRLADELRRQHVLDIEERRRGLQITSFSHVGRVQLDDLTITVQPKIGPQELLSLVRYAFGLRNLRLFDTAQYQSSGSLFQDLLAAQLLAEAQDLIESGIARRYVATRSDLPLPRGRIDFGALAVRPTWDRVEVPCLDYPRSTDHLLNQVLRAGVGLAADVAQDVALARSLRRIAAQLEQMASGIHLSAAVMANADRALTRLTRPYEASIRLIELVRSSSWISLDGEGSTRLPGFLFDMNRFFQALVARFLREHLDSAQVIEERGLTTFMRYLPQKNPRGCKAPSPRPDFTVRRDGKLVTFLDAKYRDLWERDLPRDMLYQLAVYALSHESVGSAAIIYPTCSADTREAVIEIADVVQGLPRAQISLRPVDLPALAEIINDRQPGRGREIARALVFGSGADSASAA